jgi:hypothetical protein
MTECTNITDFGKSPNEIGNSPTIMELVAELKAFLPTWEAGSDDDETNTFINQRKWRLLELIDETPIMSKADAAGLVWAFEFEASRDYDFECEGSGGARSLARKLAKYVKGISSAA